MRTLTLRGMAALIGTDSEVSEASDAREDAHTGAPMMREVNAWYELREAHRARRYALVRELGCERAEARESERNT